MAGKKAPKKKAAQKNVKQAGSHVFGRPRLNQKHLTFTGAPGKSGSPFQPLPKPTGKPPFRLDLKDVLPADQYGAIAKANRLVFHVAGDLGGINFAVPQERVAQGLEEDFVINPADPSVNPAFLYVLGDCVYFNGQISQYYAQFYQPYEHYLAPIFAAPGNHDGDPMAPEKSLDGFVRNFCAAKPGTKTPESQDSPRTAMTQPNVYWTLLTPLVNIVGLYSNVPEGGVVKQPQIDWFQNELATLDKNIPLVVTLHHPVYSADAFHSGSTHMKQLIEDAANKVGRHPEMVVAGHVHNYQRFTKTMD